MEYLANSSYLYSIFQIPKLGTKLKQDTIPITHTPRKFITHPNNGYFYLIEGDHRVIGEEAAKQQLDKLVRSHRHRNEHCTDPQYVALRRQANRSGDG